MNLFGTKLESLKRRSAGQFSIFQKTITNLVKINSEIETEQQKLRDEITERETSHDVLETQKLQNQKVVDKLNKFFND